MSPLVKHESAARAVAADLRKQVERAREILEHKRLTDEDVHEARKHLKKARAALRLLRPALKDSSYRAWNIAMRDAARPLSAARDSKVLLDTLRLLGEQYGEQVPAVQLEGFRRVLQDQRGHAAREALGARSKVLAHSRRLLREVHGGVERLRIPHDGDDWSPIRAGLKRVYSRGRRALAEARKTGSPEAFHEWRKQAKYLRYNLEYLEPLWPAMIGEMVDQAHRLTDYLGDEHDFSVLREAVLAHRAAFRDAATLDAVLALIDRCQSQLREKALLLGSRLYQEKPRVFADRISEYWRNWRDEKSAAA
ncbi:MAG TPA: CHAD domain-containing protein [Steroidobacteraceae bacterium]|jgi:CHAD domain-containing protein|nr:CHAD domain-containing protein [Steroidobacteraceae bacterium]